MTNEQAAIWLDQVDGTVFLNRHDHADDHNRYIAMVRTPAQPGQTGKIILAYGDSFGDAARAAEEEWQSVWRLLSQVH